MRRRSPGSTLREPRLTLRRRLSLAREIVAAYREVRRVTAGHRLPAAVVRLRAPREAPSDQVLSSAEIEGARLGRAVIRTLAPLPQGSKCLTQSLVMLVLLARRGAQATLVIAVHPGEQMLDAHAWVELDERPLLPPGTHHERLLVL